MENAKSLAEKEMKLKQLHLERLEMYDRFYIFRYSSGMKKVIGTKVDRVPMPIAKRLGSQNGWGNVVTYSLMNKDQARKYMKELDAVRDEVLDPDKYKDINTPEDIIEVKPKEEAPKVVIPETPLQEDEISTKFTVVKDGKVEFYDSSSRPVITHRGEGEEDEELIGFIIAGKDEAMKLAKRFERLFNYTAEVEDADDTEVLVFMARGLQKRLGALDDIVEKICENLEGA